MKTTLTTLLLSTFVAGCSVRDSLAPRHADETSQSAPRVECNRRQTLEESDVEAVFPYVMTTYRKWNLNVIESYCRQRGIQSLQKDRIRLFVQPMGIVANAYEIDLASRKLTVYPGTHGDEDIIDIRLADENIARVKRLVNSPDFRDMQSENQKIGMDGTSYMLEVLIDDEYHWVLHWSPDDEHFVRIIEHIRNMARNRNTEPEAGGYRR